MIAPQHIDDLEDLTHEARDLYHRLYRHFNVTGGCDTRLAFKANKAFDRWQRRARAWRKARQAHTERQWQ